MRSGVPPEHIDYGERREGVIAFVDRFSDGGHREPAVEEWSSTTTASTRSPHQFQLNRCPASAPGFLILGGHQ